MISTTFKFQVSNFQCIVIGVSAGGMEALPAVLSPLPPDFPIPVIVVQHMSPDSDDGFFIEYLNKHLGLKVKQADEREQIVGGAVYVAPADYHLLIENDKTFSLSVDERVKYSRPSIDVLFETAVEAYGPELIGIILTGASSDGACGLKMIKDRGGLTIVQDPETAKSNLMPLSAIETAPIDHILALEDIPKLLLELGVKRET